MNDRQEQDTIRREVPKFTPREVTRWQTETDEFNSLEYATKRQLAAENADLATDAFRAGAPLGECLLMVDPARSVPATIEDLDTSTKLVITHWQCCETPAYNVGMINADGTVWVSGVGGWSGSYGQDIDLLDLARYLEDTLKR